MSFSRLRTLCWMTVLCLTALCTSAAASSTAAMQGACHSFSLLPGGTSLAASAVSALCQQSAEGAEESAAEPASESAAEQTVAPTPVQTEPQYAYVSGDSVNVRSGAGTEFARLTQLSRGTKVTVLQQTEHWWQVQYGSCIGWMHSDYLAESASAASSVGSRAAALARSYLGVPYVYGGSSPSGFDCSGFTSYIYKQLGYPIQRTASTQWQSNGTYVSRSDLQAGDLVFFRDPARANGKPASHVGIYIGDNQFIHATSSRSRCVKINSLSESYYNGYYIGAKRIG